MHTWAPLWNGIVTSSLWQEEPDHVRIVFVTMLAVKDADHVVRKTAYELGKLAHKPEEEVLDALKILCSPDKHRMEKQEYDGRRVKSVEEGYLILNGEKYREKVRIEMERSRWRRAAKAKRDRDKRNKVELNPISHNKNPSVPAQAAYLKVALEKGGDEAGKMFGIG